MRSQSLIVLAIIVITAGGALYLPQITTGSSAKRSDAAEPAPVTKPAEKEPTDVKTVWNLLGDFFSTTCADVGCVSKAAGTRPIRFLIATLPDYVDSQMRWDFDAMLDAVQAGANQLS